MRVNILTVLFFAILSPFAQAATVAVTWNIAQTKGKTYQAKIGDVLQFKWTGSHNVRPMANNANYNSCIFTTAALPISSFSSTYTVTQKKTYYFGCGIGNHCGQGMKIKVIVT